jgi:hypothetical protein
MVSVAQPQGESNVKEVKMPDDSEETLQEPVPPNAVIIPLTSVLRTLQPEFSTV